MVLGVAGCHRCLGRRLTRSQAPRCKTPSRCPAGNPAKAGDTATVVWHADKSIQPQQIRATFDKLPGPLSVASVAPAEPARTTVRPMPRSRALPGGGRAEQEGVSFLRIWTRPAVMSSSKARLLRPRSGLEEFFGERFDAGADLVADGADGFNALAGGVFEGPVEVALAGEDGQTSPQPIVMQTSEDWTAWTVRTLGFRWRCRCRPRSWPRQRGVDGVGGGGSGGADRPTPACPVPVLPGRAGGGARSAGAAAGHGVPLKMGAPGAD